MSVNIDIKKIIKLLNTNKKNKSNTFFNSISKRNELNDDMSRLILSIAFKEDSQSVRILKQYSNIISNISTGIIFLIYNTYGIVREDKNRVIRTVFDDPPHNKYCDVSNFSKQCVLFYNKTDNLQTINTDFKLICKLIKKIL